jgi:hypothetical protein
MSFEDGFQFNNKQESDPIIPIESESEEVMSWDKIEEADRKMMAAELGLPSTASKEEIGEAFRVSRAIELGLDKTASWEEIEFRLADKRIEDIKEKNK